VTPVGELYLSRLPPAARERWGSYAALSSELTAALAAAAAAWPTLQLDDSELVGYLAARAEPDPPESGAFPHAADLALACAVCAGNAQAMQLFEAHYLDHIGVAVHRFRLGNDGLDELKQTLRRQLLMSEAGRPPRLGDYSGRGPLAAWLRVAAMRSAIKARRGVRDFASEDDALQHIAAGGASPEADIASAEMRGMFRDALREAITSLEPQEQNVLRQHHLDGLTLDELAKLYAVHRTTVAYWLQRARERLFKRTRTALLGRPGVTAADCDSLFRHAASHLAITIKSLFVR
jgi:RNA polymerase sigma-70 factor (ECF subfamily)